MLIIVKKFYMCLCRGEHMHALIWVNRFGVHSVDLLEIHAWKPRLDIFYYCPHPLKELQSLHVESSTLRQAAVRVKDHYMSLDTHKCSKMIYTPLLCQKIKLESLCSQFNCSRGLFFNFIFLNDPAATVSSEDLSPPEGRLLHVLPPKCNIPNLPSA